MQSYQAEQIVDVLTEIRDELRRANEIQTAVHTPVKITGGIPEAGQWQPSWESQPHFGHPSSTIYGR